MNNSLQVFSNNDFSVRTRNDKDGSIWFVARDIAQALDYSEASTKQMNNLFGNVPAQWKGHKRIMTPGGEQEMLCLTEQGVYFFLGRSDKPKALPYQMWIAGDVVPSIRKTGTYSVSTLPMSKEEYELRLNTLNLERAKLLNSMLEKPAFPMTPETKTVFAHEVFKLASGHEYLAMLPECTEKFYTATEIGEKLGISANKVGRIAKKHSLKAPEGESNEYGRWIFSKSRNSNREVSSFIYSEDALDWFSNFFMEVNHE